MSLEEIKAYNSLITKTDDIKEVFSIIDKIDSVFDLNLIAESLLNDISILKMIDDSSKEISLLSFKVRCIWQRIDELKEKINDKGTVNLLFATSNGGNIYALDDTKSIDKSYYSEIGDCLDDIRNGAEMKTLVNNDNRRNVLSYKKGNGKQVRVYAVKVFGNYLCVFGVAIKKDNWSKKMSTMLDSRMAIVTDEVQKFKNMITAGEDGFIKDNQDIYNDLKRMLDFDDRNPYFEECKNYLISYSKNYTTRMLSTDKLYDLLDELDLRELCEISKLVSSFEIPDFIKNIIQEKIREIYISDYGSPIERATKLKRG